ncbi:MAG: hypothetical protein HZA24_03310 [Nitrospirae bacterium]|nr:hypothetical protein [Nitrospirota bacterium]
MFTVINTYITLTAVASIVLFALEVRTERHISEQLRAQRGTARSLPKAA